MYESPCSLEELCLDTICDNISFYTKYDMEEKCYKFTYNDLYLFKEISEKLLAKFQEKNLISDPLMGIFNAYNTKLRRVCLRNCDLSQKGLVVLKQHKIVDLECVNLRNICIGDVLVCLNSWTIQSLISANFSECSFTDRINRHSYMVEITNLKNLRALNLAHTKLNQPSLEMICQDLKFLERLDISAACIKDISPLILLAERLISLSMCDLPYVSNFATTLTSLPNLRHLDVSLFNEKLVTEAEKFSEIQSLIRDPSVLPHLVSLDVSGWRDRITTDQLLSFVSAHHHLQFLGIVLTDCAFDEIFNTPLPALVIAGLGNETQIKSALTKYWSRANYVQKALYHLFQFTNITPEARPDMFNLVLPVMAAHSNKFGVQMAATACLYNLTRGDLCKKIHPKNLSRGVNLTLFAMEEFPLQFQLQKNALLTLCNDTILQEINFNRFHCAKLVLDALCNFDDVNMNRMAVAICSILAAKVSTEQTSELGARPDYMRKLLNMVQNRVESHVPDITLKFTLSALWNLTDESAATCTVFLEAGGAYLFLNVLKRFKDDSAIETKVLGLLNNIAEVGKLRNSLMLDALMEELFTLLNSDNIDVSYFAAGIVAHLASDGIELWKVTSHSRNEMLEKLQEAVSQWKMPECEMVAYRSFRPFFSLLRIEIDFQVQLWAVWAIHHVCTKNPKRYCVMLQEENGHLLLNDLIHYNDSHPDIKSIARQILETVAGHT